MVRCLDVEDERVRLLGSPEPERVEQRFSRRVTPSRSDRSGSPGELDALNTEEEEEEERLEDWTNRCIDLGMSEAEDSNQQTSLQVVRDILEEMESMDAEDDVETGGRPPRNLDQDNPESCAGCRLPGSTDLVVDVHLESIEEIPRPCVKHSFDRFPRCYSESRGNLSREEFRNLDKIETIGEDRLRHMSEGAGRGRGGRSSRGGGGVRGVFCSEKGTLHHHSSRSPERKYEISEYDSSPTVSNMGSTQQLDSVDGASSSRVEVRPVRAEPEPTSSRPAVKFEIFEDPGTGTESPDSSMEQSQIEFHAHTFKDSSVPGISSGYKTTMSSSSSTTSMPICRICQLPSIEPSNHLISPCRCLGSIRYVHNPCLLKWLEVCSRKNPDAPCCELCQFQYIRKKRFVISHCLFPSCSTKDRILHSIFLLSIALMVTCAGVTILCFKQDRDSKPKTVGPNTELSPSELMTLSCGVLFFLAFFVAMYVEVKAKNTVYQLICKFLYMNYDWTIQEYDRKKDPAKQIEDS